ncbi:MAG: GxxExxY protein [Desulfuromonadales bacterium]|nr:GxxExxY protein [Desulfuromonadales bacterium]
METREVVYRDLSYEVMAAVFEVQNTLGSGFLEKVYENALLVELKGRGILAEAQKEIQVIYKGVQVGSYYADLLVNNEIIVELKSTEAISKTHEAQLLNYLKATGMKLGLLINFGKTRLEHKRFVI